MLHFADSGQRTEEESAQWLVDSVGPVTPVTDPGSSGPSLLSLSVSYHQALAGAGVISVFNVWEVQTQSPVHSVSHAQMLGCWACGHSCSACLRALWERVQDWARAFHPLSPESQGSLWKVGERVSLGLMLMVDGVELSRLHFVACLSYSVTLLAHASGSQRI